jgi:hypothetical protein
MGAGCKPAGFCLRWFESNTLHQADTASQSRAEMDRRPDPESPQTQSDGRIRTMPSTSSSFSNREPQASRSRLGRGRAPVGVAASWSVRLGSRFSAGVAQLVERQPSKLNVASSNLVSRSISFLGFGCPSPKPFAGAGSFLVDGRPNPKPCAGFGSFLAVRAPSSWLPALLALWGVVCFVGVCFAHLAQLVEHVLGKDEVTSSILVVGSRRLEGVAGIGADRPSQRAFRFAVAAA